MNQGVDRLSKAWQRYGWRLGFEAMRRLLSAGEQASRQAKLRVLLPIEIGHQVILESDVSFTTGCRIRLGAKSFVGRRTLFELAPCAGLSLDIGDESWISRDCHIQALRGLIVGNRVLIGEFVSLRDTTHRYKGGDPGIKEQGDVYGHVRIEDGVWIGRGALILGRPEGVVIGEGSVIAANSTVHESVPARTIWGGVPARQIGTR